MRSFTRAMSVEGMDGDGIWKGYDARGDEEEEEEEEEDEDGDEGEVRTEFGEICFPAGREKRETGK